MENKNKIISIREGTFEVLYTHPYKQKDYYIVRNVDNTDFYLVETFEKGEYQTVFDKQILDVMVKAFEDYNLRLYAVQYDDKPDKTVASLIKKAEKGDTDVQMELATYYLRRNEVGDTTRSFYWMLEAAKKNRHAMCMVGYCYETGSGVTADINQAYDWYVKSYEAGDAVASFLLGKLYFDGNGVSKDIEKGMDLITLAADSDVMEANDFLALHYYTGIKNYRGKSKYTDPELAYKYAVRSSELSNNSQSQYIAGYILENYYRNIEEAREWYNKAAQNGNDEAKSALSRLNSNSRIQNRSNVDQVNSFTANPESNQYVDNKLVNKSFSPLIFILLIALVLGFILFNSTSDSEKFAEVSEETMFQGDFIIPDSNTRYIDSSELESFSENECQLAINEIYARNGRKFTTPEIQEYFNSKSWYTPRIEANDFNDSMLSEVERANVNTLVNYAKSKGWR